MAKKVEGLNQSIMATLKSLENAKDNGTQKKNLTVLRGPTYLKTISK